MEATPHDGLEKYDEQPYSLLRYPQHHSMACAIEEHTYMNGNPYRTDTPLVDHDHSARSSILAAEETPRELLVSPIRGTPVPDWDIATHLAVGVELGTANTSTGRAQTHLPKPSAAPGLAYASRLPFDNPMIGADTQPHGVAGPPSTTPRLNDVPLGYAETSYHFLEDC